MIIPLILTTIAVAAIIYAFYRLFNLSKEEKKQMKITEEELQKQIEKHRKDIERSYKNFKRDTKQYIKSKVKKSLNKPPEAKDKIK